MVKKLMKESRDQIDKDWGSAPSRTPFTDNILKETYPDKFTLPTVPSYDGTRDPQPHLYKYSWCMDGVNALDDVFIILFN